MILIECIYPKLKHSDTGLDKWGEVEAEVKKYFAEALLSESFVDRRTYAIPQSTVSSLSTAFTSLEKCKHSCILGYLSC